MTISETVYYILKEDTEFKAKVKNRIYPLVAPDGAEKYPFAVFSYVSAGTVGTKDGREREVTVAVTIVDKNYDNAHETAAMVEDVFIKAEATANQNDLYDPEFLRESEEYSQELDAYLVKTEINFTQEV